MEIGSNMVLILVDTTTVTSSMMTRTLVMINPMLQKQRGSWIVICITIRGIMLTVSLSPKVIVVQKQSRIHPPIQKVKHSHDLTPIHSLNQS